jgi:Cu/Ag efflux protein CusF
VNNGGRLRLVLRGLLPLLLLAGSHAACSGGEEGDGAAAEVTVQRYEVRGEVTRLPSPPADALYLRHEAIAGFVGIDGEVVGMDSMTMPFPVGEGVELDGVEVGDKVGFTLEVEWEGDPPYRITGVEELGAETVLDLGA